MHVYARLETQWRLFSPILVFHWAYDFFLFPFFSFSLTPTEQASKQMTDVKTLLIYQIRQTYEG